MTGGAKIVEWGGHHGDWGGFGPPSYIVKKCPVTLAIVIIILSGKRARTRFDNVRGAIFQFSLTDNFDPSLDFPNVLKRYITF